ncbi:MAG: hypothetical protein ACYDCS_05440 [Candidatus Dormibacteria bacterium]
MAGKLKAFALFWYDFLVGDDWLVAVGVVLALAGTVAVSRTNVSCWWIVPAAVVLLLPGTVWRATRSRGTRDTSAPS